MYQGVAPQGTYKGLVVERLVKQGNSISVSALLKVMEEMLQQFLNASQVMALTDLGNVTEGNEMQLSKA